MSTTYGKKVVAKWIYRVCNPVDVERILSGRVMGLLPKDPKAECSAAYHVSNGDFASAFMSFSEAPEVVVNHIQVDDHADTDLIVMVNQRELLDSGCIQEHYTYRDFQGEGFHWTASHFALASKEVVVKGCVPLKYIRYITKKEALSARAEVWNRRFKAGLGLAENTVCAEALHLAFTRKYGEEIW